MPKAGDWRRSLGHLGSSLRNVYPEVLSALEWVGDVRIEGESVIVEAPSERSSELSAALGRSEVYVTEMAADEMSLEQYFLDITGDGQKETR